MGECSATSEPHRSCYMSRVRNEAIVQRGHSEEKKSFFILIILLQRDFSYLKENLFFRFYFLVFTPTPSSKKIETSFYIFRNIPIPPNVMNIVIMNFVVIGKILTGSVL